MRTLTAAPLAARDQDWLLGQLPVGMLEDPLFVRLVRSFQSVADTLLEGADNITSLADPAVAPLPMVRYLAGWLGLDLLDPGTPEHEQRELARRWGDVLAWRGTRRGLTAFLEALTDAPVELTDDAGIYRPGEAPAPPATIRVRVQGAGWLNDEQLRAVIAAELPVHLAHEIEIAARPAAEQAS